MDEILIGILIALLIYCIILISIRSCLALCRGGFNSIQIFDNQPYSLGVYNVEDIEPVILKSK